MNAIDTYAEITPAAGYTPPPFPTWPPPSGGYPNTTPEDGPMLNPHPYGSTQTGNINTSVPMPPFNATHYPQSAGVGKNGQNQGGIYQLPPSTKPLEVGPTKAPTWISAGSPPYIMGPGPQGTQPYEAGPAAGTPPPGRTFPSGSYIDGYGQVITPTGVVRTIGGLGN